MKNKFQLYQRHTSEETSHPGIRAADGKVPVLTGRHSSFSTVNLTRSGRRELDRRARLLESFDVLTLKGLSYANAAKELGESVTTLWRYRKRVEPLTAQCGRKTTLKKHNVPAQILSLVRQLQLGGKSNVDAWKMAALDPRCPAALAEYLKSTRNIAASLLAATRLTRRKVTVVECADFSLITKPKKTTK